MKNRKSMAVALRTASELLAEHAAKFEAEPKGEGLSIVEAGQYAARQFVLSFEANGKVVMLQMYEAYDANE